MPDNSVASSPVGIVGQWGGRVLRGMRRASAGLPAGDDWALWHQACSGDAPSARALVRALTPQAHGLAMQLLRKTEDAQDVVQESFLRLWSSRPSDACGARLTTFFNTIVINRCKTHLTKRREFTTDHETLVAIADGNEHAQPDHATAMGPISSHQLQQALGALPARQRMALAMWAYADAQAAQIADSFEIDVNAAHQLLHRAKRALRLALSGDTV
ncbi:MAG: sigma-70 family RNA polymerase sigma factor [Rhodoferax sp.]|nr:sigma-70 family RNA polymerase sigma factor [Rhodoferax sp.]